MDRTVMTGIPIRFQGRDYLLIGDMENGGSIATRKQWENLEMSFAFLGSDGTIRRNQRTIGHRSDIEVVRSDERTSDCEAQPPMGRPQAVPYHEEPNHPPAINERMTQPKTDQEKRAAMLRDQVMKTWRPPMLAGGETAAQIAQTCTMQAIAFIMGRDFMPDQMTMEQRAAIDQGLALFESFSESTT